jgi:hypothetical protein
MEQPETRTAIWYEFFQHPTAANESAGIGIWRYSFAAAEATAAAAAAAVRAKDRAGQVSEFDLMAGSIRYTEAIFPLVRMF